MNILVQDSQICVPEYKMRLSVLYIYIYIYYIYIYIYIYTRTISYTIYTHI